MCKATATYSTNRSLDRSIQITDPISDRTNWGFDMLHYDVVEAHCYVVDIGQTDGEQIRSRFSNKWLQDVPLLTACTLFCMQLTKAYVAKTSCNQLLLIPLRICARLLRSTLHYFREHLINWSYLKAPHNPTSAPSLQTYLVSLMQYPSNGFIRC